MLDFIPFFMVVLEFRYQQLFYLLFVHLICKACWNDGFHLKQNTQRTHYNYLLFRLEVEHLFTFYVCQVFTSDFGRGEERERIEGEGKDVCQFLGALASSLIVYNGV